MFSLPKSMDMSLFSYQPRSNSIQEKVEMEAQFDRETLAPMWSNHGTAALRHHGLHPAYRIRTELISPSFLSKNTPQTSSKNV
jgi:hypothetical protein